MFQVTITLHINIMQISMQVSQKVHILKLQKTMENLLQIFCKSLMDYQLQMLRVINTAMKISK
jgi:hypothetical protein